MVYLIDTNVLLAVAHPADSRYPVVQAAIRKLWVNAYDLQTTLQNFSEFWNVSTRPTDRNGFGRTSFETGQLLQRLERLFPLLPDSPAMYPEWKRLVVNYRVLGVQVHDARLVAAMLIHDVTHILTFNTQDFTRYAPEGIVAVNPAAV